MNLHFLRYSIVLSLLFFSSILNQNACDTNYLYQTDNTSDNTKVKDKASKKKSKKIKTEERETILKDYYLFGVAQNYHDSITYFTNISPIKNVVCDKATGFIDGLNLYTNQLEKYLLQQGHAGYICATFYAKSMKEAEKKYITLRKKISKHDYTRIEPLGNFIFQFVSPENIYRNVINPNSEDETEHSDNNN